MHQKPEYLLARAIPLLDVVVDGSVVLSTPVLGFGLAAAAGFTQLFSP